MKKIALALLILLAVTPAFAKKHKKPKGPRHGKFTLERFERSMYTKEIEQKQRQMARLRVQMIAKLKKLLNSPYYQNKAEICFRLAEAYWQDSKWKYMQAMKRYTKAMEAYQAGTLKKKPVAPKEDYSVALQYYRRVLQEDPNYARMDEVMYYLGSGALMEAKLKKDPALRKEGIKELNDLVQRFPKSRFVTRAYLALAETYFNHSQFYFAKANYEKIIHNFPNSPMYNYALYKLGWVYFNLMDYERTIKTFQKVVEAVSKQPSKIEFRSQALNDLVVTYAEVEHGWDRAKDYFFSVLPKEKAWKKMHALAELYVGKDMVPEAIRAYREFIEYEKITPAVLDYYKTIMSLYRNTNDYESAATLLKEILQYFDRNGKWWAANKSHPEVLKAADKFISEHIMWIATYFHAKAQKKNKPELYKRAAYWYKQFLDRFPNAKEAYKVNFYYAEILYGQEHDYKDAAKQYQLVIDRDKKGEFVEDAALGLIYCYDELMVQAGLRQVAQKGKKIQVVKFKKKENAQEKPIPRTKLKDLERKYIAAADQYVKLVSAVMKDPKRRKKHPNMGKKIPEMMFIAAQTFYKHGQFVQAVKRLQVLFQYAPRSKFAAYGVFIILDCYRRLKRWNKVEEWARKLIKARNFTVKSKKELEKLVAIAMTENARQMAMERHFSSAIREGLKVYREFRHDKKLAPKALFNVAALYEKKRDTRNAIHTYERVVREYPKSSVAPEALFTIGLINESQTNFKAAARSFERMKKFRKAKQTPEALIDAGLIWEALGQYKKAIIDYKNYIRWFPKKKDKARIHLHIAEVYEMMGTKRGKLMANRVYRQWLARHYDAPLDWRVKAYTKIGKNLYDIDRIRYRRQVTAAMTNAIKAFTKITKPKELAHGKYYAAEAAFFLAEYAFYDFQQVKLPSTLKKSVLKAALIKKATAHKKAEKMYDKVLDFKSGQWSAAAAFRIGLLYSTFAKELLDLPVPQQLTPEQQQDYEALIQIQFAQPVQAKAQTAFKHALELAHEKGAYNKYTKMCAKYAHEVNPDDFPVAGEPLVKPDHPKDTLMSTSFIRVLKRGDVIVTIKKKK